MSCTLNFQSRLYHHLFRDASCFDLRGFHPRTCALLLMWNFTTDGIVVERSSVHRSFAADYYIIKLFTIPEVITPSHYLCHHDNLVFYDYVTSPQLKRFCHVYHYTSAPTLRRLITPNALNIISIRSPFSLIGIKWSGRIREITPLLPTLVTFTRVVNPRSSLMNFYMLPCSRDYIFISKRCSPFRFKGFSPTHLCPTPVAYFKANGIVVEPSSIHIEAWLLIVSEEMSQQLKELFDIHRCMKGHILTRYFLTSF